MSAIAVLGADVGITATRPVAFIHRGRLDIEYRRQEESLHAVLSRRERRSLTRQGSM